MLMETPIATQPRNSLATISRVLGILTIIPG